MIYIGIDPGKQGGYSVINTFDNSVACYFWDELGFIETIRTLAESYKTNEIITCVELVHSMPTDSHKVAFSFGYQTGFIKAVLMAFKIPYQEISPMKWKKEFNLIKKSKEESIKVCKQLYPTISLKRTERCAKDSDGMAESLLMATYAKRIL